MRESNMIEILVISLQFNDRIVSLDATRITARIDSVVLVEFKPVMFPEFFFFF